MRIFQSKNLLGQAWTPDLAGDLSDADLVLVFGNRKLLGEAGFYEGIRLAYPNAVILSGSTAGEIIGTEVLDDSAVMTAVKFDHTRVKGCSVLLSDDLGRRKAGEKLGKELMDEGLALVFVVSDGQNVNGSSLVEGLNDVLGNKVPITGGLAGDSYDFQETVVGMNGVPKPGNVAAVGFYGDRLKVGYGTVGGWDPFGPIRTVTQSRENILFELDGKSALTLYKEYLGDRADELPGSALLFPLTLLNNTGGEPLVRTVLGVDEAANSMTFAGDIPEGSQVRLMKANFDRIVGGAIESAELSLGQLHDFRPDLAILISCVGRKLILGPRVDEEVEEVHDILGEHPAMVGFYSYGEISPGERETGCSLFNQTMTITTLAEQ